MKFQVVDPAEVCGDPEPEDWTHIDADTFEDAAEAFCDCSDRENRYEYIKANGGEVLVKDGNGLVYLVTVSAQTECVYNAIKSVEQSKRPPTPQ
jgi:hypothetical protein